MTMYGLSLLGDIVAVTLAFVEQWGARTKEPIRRRHVCALNIIANRFAVTLCSKQNMSETAGCDVLLNQSG